MRGFFYAPKRSYEQRVSSFEIVSPRCTLSLATRNS